MCYVSNIHFYKSKQTTRSSKKIKAVKSEACVIALTASSDDKTKESVFEAGMDDFVTKPIIPNELYKIIKNQLSKARVSR